MQSFPDKIGFSVEAGMEEQWGFKVMEKDMECLFWPLKVAGLSKVILPLIQWG